ncbi:laccase domain-containing protein [Halomonas chromatireducens]|uniref:Uncharacterized protein n=1 Tax=Halomonas chromatireducens TaxID=507626 RepID=A0A0X8HAR6_9GAMM|nr:hypothetical protein LOKO_00087 [Halomonas chromatireducens]
MSDAPHLQPTLIEPDWPAPLSVGAFVTTRESGPSQGDFASFNLSDRVGDNPNHVALCRRLLTECRCLRNHSRVRSQSGRLRQFQSERPGG